MPFTVLVVDDDADTRLNLCDILHLDGFHVEAVGTAADALARHDWGRYGAILLDHRLPDGSADELLPQLCQLAPDAAVVIVTGFADVPATISAFRLGAADYVLKPINPDELRGRLGRIAEHWRDRKALRDSQALTRSILDSLIAHIAVLDRDGQIVAINAAWEGFARLHGANMPQCGVGMNYLDVCRRSSGPYGDEAPLVERGIRAVLSGEEEQFSIE